MLTAATTVMLVVSVAVLLPPSVTWTVNDVRPGLPVGVPLMMPVLDQASGPLAASRR